jgi:hypothetical protein
MWDDPHPPSFISPRSQTVDEKLRQILENVVAYCEDQAIYDKLGKYGDFYYKIKMILKEDAKPTDTN